MNGLAKAFHLLLLMIIGSLLFASIECAPLESVLATGEEPIHHNKEDLLRLFLEDAKLASSSNSNDQSSEEWKQNMLNMMKNINAALGPAIGEPVTVGPPPQVPTLKL
ncbi:uncharacterized protein LOC129775495 [Toxorhynchites rutilus septentrionalis]|uniref:uncharacterized protein LOC129775495 n=1 Tax=Toxorhynchites rutilus septentrionalis TaxID=329112 RepID=UPI0024790763|nr:uncharacterized protein LOC129775495 [Toxorhynchites rutilus septentrionalis]